MQQAQSQQRESGLSRTPYRWVRIWLWTGVAMLLLQFMIGAVTRLTGSGLSITKWEIAIGTVPPLNEVQWQEAFDLYKQTPQYHKINKGMSLSDFKFIYFWEYFHRLWARTLGFVFIIPFAIFLSRRMIDRKLMLQLITVVLLGGLVGIFGWIMVASGLVNRPWVNAYKLTLHLNLAFLVYGYLLWIAIGYSSPQRHLAGDARIKRGLKWFLGILIVQLLLGGIMSGMKAGLFYPTWPDYSGEWMPPILTEGSSWSLAHLTDYDTHLFAPSLIQFLHRNIAYVLLLLGLLIFTRIRRDKIQWADAYAYFFLFSLLLQVVLGILVLIYSSQQIPVFLGVLHQSGALWLLSAVILLHWKLRS